MLKAALATIRSLCILLRIVRSALLQTEQLQSTAGRRPKVSAGNGKYETLMRDHRRRLYFPSLFPSPMGAHVCGKVKLVKYGYGSSTAQSCKMLLSRRLLSLRV